MFKRRNQIIAILLLVMFLLPSWVKIEHHHEHIANHTNKEKQVHEYHEPCILCSFEFSILDSAYEVIVLNQDNPVAYYCVYCKTILFSDPSRYTFLLRAPPCLTT